jgi:hypothetical protein
VINCSNNARDRDAKFVSPGQLIVKHSCGTFDERCCFDTFNGTVVMSAQRHPGGESNRSLTESWSCIKTQWNTAGDRVQCRNSLPSRDLSGASVSLNSASRRVLGAIDIFQQSRRLRISYKAHVLVPEHGCTETEYRTFQWSWK